MTSSVTPAKLGYRWPAEWEPHAATWCSWPHNRDSWPGKFEPVPPQYANFVRAIAQFEPVHVLAGGHDVWKEAHSYVGGMRNVTIHDIPTNDAWCRDHGPTFLQATNHEPAALVNWEYNAWGGKYPPFDDDNAVPGKIAAWQRRRCFSPGIVLEGGAIDGNGRGVVLTTEKCLLNPNRNGAMSRHDIEKYLFDFLSARKILWLSSADLAGDDTDGHIDQLARFVNTNTIVAAVETNRDDVNFAPLQANLEQLQSMTDDDGRPFRIITIPMPCPKFQGEQRMPASYLNFYIANGLVIVPQYDDPADRVAVETLQSLFPDRAVRGLPALHLVWGLGTFHCMTQQEPMA